MSIEEAFGILFKPEIKSSGRKLVTQEKVSLTSGSDTAVQAYVRVAPPAKVNLSSEVTGTSITADCSCPVAKKNRFCKHIWATLLAAEERYPDFFIGKSEIEKLNAPASPHDEKQKTYEDTAKQRASDYRKEQYQKQKSQAKERKNQSKPLVNSFLCKPYSAEEEVALSYFSENGFPMPNGPSKEILAEAKRKLSRIFHPDKGGSHEESVELNKNCEILSKW